ncbi:hypothetical protein HD806DRAFT_481392 [Xylariaceae sp. AK1471]|nr:hypothetical protein HD806DRAFT_481392 [Xylariaceae sp. AK1471]
MLTWCGYSSDAGARYNISNGRLNVLHAVAGLGNCEAISCVRPAKRAGPGFRSASTDGLTPLGELRQPIHRVRKAGTGIVKDRNPALDEIFAFEELLGELRDRGIIAEVAKLE